MESHPIYTTFIILMLFVALFSYLNTKFIRLAPSIGILLISLVFSMLLLVFSNWFPFVATKMHVIIDTIDFSDLLMHVMLGFLMFAGGLHVEIAKFRQNLPAIITFSTISVIISTAVIGFLLYFILAWAEIDVPLIYCFVFGALISPTDPIAVSSILSKSTLPKGLQMKIAGESLLNDGVGIVLFIGLLDIASRGQANYQWWEILWLFVREAGGGLAWGLIVGTLCFYLLRSVDDYITEICITLAIVMGGYLLAEQLDVSGALAMAVTGIITGNKGRLKAMSDRTKEYLLKFWELIDEILNALLFLLIGLEMLIIPIHGHLLIVGPLTYLAVMVARWLSVMVPGFFLNRKYPLEADAIKILTWCGLRGGISVALALSLRNNNFGDHFVAITYTVVVLSIILQGSTIGSLLRRLEKKRQQGKSGTSTHYKISKDDEGEIVGIL